MTEETLSEKYNRLHREGRTEEATQVARQWKYGDSEPVQEDEEEQDELRHMVYTELNGVGEELAEEIFHVYGDWDNFVENVDKEGLVDVSGIGESRAESLLEQVEEG